MHVPRGGHRGAKDNHCRLRYHDERHLLWGRGWKRCWWWLRRNDTAKKMSNNLIVNESNYVVVGGLNLLCGVDSGPNLYMIVDVWHSARQWKRGDIPDTVLCESVRSVCKCPDREPVGWLWRSSANQSISPTVVDILQMRIFVPTIRYDMYQK